MATRMLVPVGDLSLSVQVAGSGPPLLLVHAYPLRSELWEAQIRTFAATRRVIAPDLRGFGESGVPSSAAAVSMSQYADDLAEVLNALGVAVPVSYVGVSMGGYIGWEFARRHRDRVSGLVAVCTTPAEDDAAGRQKRESIAGAVLTDPNATLQPLPKSLLGRTSRQARPELLTRVSRWIERTDPVAIAAAQLGMAGRWPHFDWLARTDLPVLAVAGEEDAFIRADDVRDWSRKISNGRFEVIDDAGHLPMLEQPAAFNATLQSFLDTLDAAGPA